jgi:hypothetical protein
MTCLQDSPFCEEAENRKRYLAYTSSHPCSGSFLCLICAEISNFWIGTSKEREALRKQVINENKRLVALELHNRCVCMELYIYIQSAC